MIDFNKIEDYLIRIKDIEKFDKVPMEHLIPRGEIIKNEDVLMLVELFKKYNILPNRIKKIQSPRYKYQLGYEYIIENINFILELTCSNCKKTEVRDFDDFKDVFFKFYENGSSENWYHCEECQVEIDRVENERKQAEEAELMARKEQERKDKEQAEKERRDAEELRICSLTVDYMEKYKNRSFDLYDAISLFLNNNNDDNIKIINKLLKKVDMQDLLEVAFGEPHSFEKKNYICGYYSFNNYNEFLKTPYWQMVSLIKKDYKPFCEFCGSTDHLNIHHKDYQRVHGEEHLINNIQNELVTLCSECHKKVHKILLIH